MKKLSPKFICFCQGKIKGTAIYEYDEQIQSMLYQFKGCYDIELREVFLNPYITELKLKYHNYVIVPIPSFISDDKAREFNHVIEMFSFLNLPIIKAIVKLEKYKQSDQKYKDRTNVRKILGLSEIESLKNKKILLVDDVYTTGNTIQASIDLLTSLKPKKIEILVMAKVKEKH